MEEKILDYYELHTFKANLLYGKKIVLVTGVFDLLHCGHTQFLQKSKQYGDILLVGLESDERVRKLKGDDRPVEPVEARLKDIGKLEYVDFAFALPPNFDRIEREHFMALLRPDVLAVSSHSLHQDNKRALIEKYGGRLEIVMEQDKHYSTTKTILKKQSKNKSAK